MNDIKELLLSTNVPVKTDSYSPVSHGDIINSIYEQLDRKNLKVVKENYRVGANGNQVVGLLGVESYDSEIGFMIGFKNSYDKSMSLGFAVGGQVFICENGVVRGDISLIRKHTGGVSNEICDKIITSIDRFDGQLKYIQKDFARMKEIELSKRTQAELIGRLFVEEELITSTQVSLLKREAEFSKEFKGNSLYDFYNWGTETLKISNPKTNIEDHIKLHKFVESEFLLTV